MISAPQLQNLAAHDLIARVDNVGGIMWMAPLPPPSHLPLHQPPSHPSWRPLDRQHGWITALGFQSWYCSWRSGLSSLQIHGSFPSRFFLQGVLLGGSFLFGLFSPIMCFCWIGSPMLHRRYCIWFKCGWSWRKKLSFSVASNKVGHFIYTLRDRIWPDFVCHFSLFKDHWFSPSKGSNSWHADKCIEIISSRSSPVVKSSLKFLEQSAANDSSAHSELAKFGFYKKLQGNLLDKFNDSLDPGDAMAHNSSLIDKVHQSSPLSTQLSDPESSAWSDYSNLKFACFNCPISLVDQDKRTAIFKGKKSC